LMLSCCTSARNSAIAAVSDVGLFIGSVPSPA